MSQTDEATRLKLALPSHIAEILTGWAVFELRKTPEEVLEALAEELASQRAAAGVRGGAGGGGVVKVKCTTVDGGAKRLQRHVEKHLEQGWRIEHYSTAAVNVQPETGSLAASVLLTHSLIWRKD